MTWIIAQLAIGLAISAAALSREARALGIGLAVGAATLLVMKGLMH
ncbi:hypothetical protein [Streptomyces sp. NPDC002067]